MLIEVAPDTYIETTGIQAILCQRDQAGLPIEGRSCVVYGQTQVLIHNHSPASLKALIDKNVPKFSMN